MITSRARSRSPGLPDRLLKRHAGAGLAIGDQALVSAANFLCMYLLALRLPVVDFGLFSAAFLGLLFLNSLQHALIVQPLNVLGPQMDEARYRLFAAVMAVGQAGGAVVAVLIFAGAGLIVRQFGSPEYGVLLLGFGLASGPWMLQEFVRRAMYTKSQEGAALLNDAVCYALQLGGIAALLMIRPSPGPALPLLVLGGSSAVAGVLGLWQIRRHISFADWTAESAREAQARARRFGKWLLAKNLVNWFGKYGHGWLLLLLLGPASLGLYRAAVQLVNVVNPLRQSVNLYLTPRMSRACQQGGVAPLRRLVRKMYLFTALPFALTLLTVAVLSKPLLALVYGGKFSGLGLEWVIGFTAAAEVIGFSRAPLEMAVLALQNTRKLFWMSMISMGILLTAGVALVLQYGIVGAPLSSVLAGIVLLVVLKRAYDQETRRAETTSAAVYRPVAGPHSPPLHGPPSVPATHSFY
jgi:O-antigen/teichoic acid export membrane protein